MVSRKILLNIDVGLWVDAPHDGIASAFFSLGDYEEGEYILNHHNWRMPAHKVERFQTIGELEIAMRKVEPDLRKWRTRME